MHTRTHTPAHTHTYTHTRPHTHAHTHAHSFQTSTSPWGLPELPCLEDTSLAFLSEETKPTARSPGLHLKTWPKSLTSGLTPELWWPVSCQNGLSGFENLALKTMWKNAQGLGKKRSRSGALSLSPAGRGRAGGGGGKASPRPGVPRPGGDDGFGTALPAHRAPHRPGPRPQGGPLAARRVSPPPWGP